jgi:hypothetical protein
MSAVIVFDDQTSYVTDPVTPCAGEDFIVFWKEKNIGDEASGQYQDIFDFDDQGSGDSQSLQCDPVAAGDSVWRSLTFNLAAGDYKMLLVIKNGAPLELGNVIIDECDGEDHFDDVDVPAIDLPTPDDFVTEEGSVDPIEDVDVGTATDLGYAFCLRYNQKPWQAVYFQAGSADEAAGWITAYTRFVNQVLVQQGYPPLASWSVGACP